MIFDWGRDGFQSGSRGDLFGDLSGHQQKLKTSKKLKNDEGKYKTMI